MAARVSVGDDVLPTTSTNTTKSTQRSQSTKRSDTMDSGLHKMFIEPSLRELSEGLNEVLEQMEKNSCGQKLDEIIRKLETILSQAEAPSQFDSTAPACLDKAAHVAMLGHSLTAYCNTLEPDQLKRFTTRVISDTTLWLSRIFRYDDSSAFFHSDNRHGLIRVCRLALGSKYDRYYTEGFNALYTKPPIIYVSAAARPGLGQYISTQLGLPLSSLCTVPCNTVFGSQHTMDIATLERLIKDDESSSKVPLLVVANAGTPLAGHVDNLNRLKTICDEYGVWLHVEGHNLATLALGLVPTSVLAAKRVHSITIQPGVWLGLPGLTSVTLYKSTDPTVSLAAGVGSSSLHDRLSALPIWLCLQCLGYNGIIAKLKHATQLSQHMQQRLNSIGSINIADKSTKENGNQMAIGSSLKEIFTKTIRVLTQADIVSPVVIFKYGDRREDTSRDPVQYTNGVDEDQLTGSLPRPLLDAFNSWLGTELSRQNPRVGIDVVDIEKDGVCLRFSPLETASYRGTTAEDIDQFLESLQVLISQLNFTWEHRFEFQEAVESRENLRFVDVLSHCGLGAVQFIPEYLNSSRDKETADKELNKINVEIAQRLQFGIEGVDSLGAVETPLGTTAIGIGVLIGPGTVDNVVDLVWSTGKELEDSSKFLESMADVVVRGIQDAQLELAKENEKRLVEEGVLRQVPIVSSFINWFSPPPKESTIRGRSLNLSSGSLESTESTYKLHMQVQQEKPSTPPANAGTPRRHPLIPASSPTSRAPPPTLDLSGSFPGRVESQGGDCELSPDEKRLQKRDLEEQRQPYPGVAEGVESGGSATTTTSNSSFQEVSHTDVSMNGEQADRN